MTKYGAPHLRPTDIQGRDLLSFILHSVSEGTLNAFSGLVECAGPLSRIRFRAGHSLLVSAPWQNNQSFFRLPKRYPSPEGTAKGYSYKNGFLCLLGGL